MLRDWTGRRPGVRSGAAPMKFAQEESGMTEQNENPEPFNFPIPGKMSTKTCNECGQEFRGTKEQEICIECSYRRDHPETRDKYWTWSRAGGGRWGIVAYWPDGEDLPDAGERVTVYRKDGSTSVETIREVGRLRYRPSGRAQLYCMTG